MRDFKPFSEWRDPRQRRGLAAELRAMEFLNACGWVVEAHRFRLGRSDIDLIIRRGNTIAFVEVKQRSGPIFGAPGEAVHWRKRLRIYRVAAAWMDRYGRPGDTYRFDLVAAARTRRGRWRLDHVADAWRL